MTGPPIVVTSAKPESMPNMTTPESPTTCNAGKNVTLHDATSGESLFTMITPHHNCGSDVNHVQLLENDAMAILSARHTNDLIKVDINTGDAIWYLGGSNGDFDIYTLTGEKIDKGESYWYGQHNAGAFGLCARACRV